MKYNEDPYVQCPFYHKENHNSIICEGICDDSTNSIRFGKGKQSFKERFCHRYYKNCGLHKLLMTKYSD